MDEDIEDNNNCKDAKEEERSPVQTDNTPRAPTGKNGMNTGSKGAIIGLNKT